MNLFVKLFARTLYARTTSIVCMPGTLPRAGMFTLNGRQSFIFSTVRALKLISNRHTVQNIYAGTLWCSIGMYTCVYNLNVITYQENVFFFCK